MNVYLRAHGKAGEPGIGLRDAAGAVVVGDGPASNRPPPAHVLVRGDPVTVKSASEILASLDGAGRLGGLPFMPEMAAFCGQSLTVHRRADKTCVEGFGLRALPGVVFLEGARCDGGAHDGCQRGCLMLWREEWLRPEGGAAPAPDPKTEARALAALRALPTRDGDRYACQSTALAEVTRPLSKPGAATLLDDLKLGELSLVGFLAIAVRAVTDKVRKRLGYDAIGQLRGPSGWSRTGLGLKPGELVRIKPRADVAITLDRNGKTAGLTFEPEMTRHCGAVFRVGGRIERMIHEETGKMVELKHTVALDGVTCSGAYMNNCPRANPPFWREAWLERVEEQ